MCKSAYLINCEIYNIIYSKYIFFSLLHYFDTFSLMCFPQYYSQLKPKTLSRRNVHKRFYFIQ